MLRYNAMICLRTLASSAPGRASPERVTGLTQVVSTASRAPCQKAGSQGARCGRPECQPPGKPCPWRQLAQVGGRGRQRELAQAAGGRRAGQANHCRRRVGRGASGNAKRRRRRRSTRSFAEEKQQADVAQPGPLSSEVVGGLRCRRDGNRAAGRGCGEHVQAICGERAEIERSVSRPEAQRAA